MKFKFLLLPAYVVFLILFTFFSYLYLDKNLVFLSSFYTGLSTTNRILVSFLFFLSIVIFFFFYFLFLRQIKKRAIRLKNVVLLTCLILFFSYPGMLSYDIFNYVTTAKVAFTYHENPYVIKPNELTGDKNLLFTRANNKIALYGPSWIVVTGIPNLLGNGNFVATLFFQKLLVIIFYLSSSFLILRITKSSFYGAIFSLNPLVVIETLVSGHNDIFMMFFALLSLHLLSQKKLMKGLLSGFVSVFVKYSTFFLIPVIIEIFINKYRKKEINWGRIYYHSAILMFAIFLLSFFREMYPWYAIWFLIFVSIVPNKRILTYMGLGFSFGLLLSYIPYIYSGNYFGSTPVIKNILIFLPVVAVLALEIRGRSWLRKFS